MRTPHTTYQLRTTVRAAAAVALTILATIAASAAPAAPAASTVSPAATVSTSRLQLVHTTLSHSGRTWSYGWPVKPFDRQHPVRSFLNDPRIGAKGNAAFHFGIDIAVPDGTPLYAVEAGTIWFDNPEAIAIIAGGSHEFGYWHVRPVVRNHQYVSQHQLIAYVAKSWGHVHFAERRGTSYVNPLRNGGLGPYTDGTAPTVDRVTAHGSSLTVSAHDTPDPKVPGAWANEPVTPALVRWRILRTAGASQAWKTAVDFRSRMLDKATFHKIYAPQTRQNHKGEPGILWFYLARTWSPSSTATVQVEVSDSAGNVAVYTARIGTTDSRL